MKHVHILSTVPESLLFVVWSSIGLWVVGWVGLWVQSFYFVMGWVGSVVWWIKLGWVEEIGPRITLTSRKTTDQIFMNNLPELFLWTSKN